MSDGGHAAVLGGGLAGMSAAVALAQEGYRVTLIEKRAALGGRAGSHFDAATGEWIDNCQHVLMPCCTNLLDFYTRTGARDRIHFYPEIFFLTDNGRLSVLKSGLLPAPFHCIPSFLKLPFLSVADKLRIVWGLCALLAMRRQVAVEERSALEWLTRHGQSARAVRDFWQLVLVSALNEAPERASFHYAAQVFLDAFLSHSRGWWLGIPSVPLSALYGDPLVRVLQRHQGRILFQSEARTLVANDGRILRVEMASGENLAADFFVLALPWRAAAAVLPEEIKSQLAAAAFEQLEPSPITGVHLWFDRAVTTLDFAALPGRQVHWFFNKTRNFSGHSSPGSYLQLVTSASRAWMDLTKSQILEIALRELGEVMPEARRARLARALVLKEPLATFSPTPQCDRLRPAAETRIANLFLAGDWTRTGWPATMEGAVRGGYLAAEAVLRAGGRPKRLLVPDLPAAGLMRLLSR